MTHGLYMFLKASITTVLFIIITTSEVQAQDVSINDLIVLIKDSDTEHAKVHEEVLLEFPIDKKELAEIYLDISYAFYKKETYQRSQYYLDKAIGFAKNIENDRLLSLAYLRQGNVFLLDWKNQQALGAYYESIDYSKKTKDLNCKAKALSGIAIIYRRMKKNEEALKICHDASKLILEEKNSINIITILSEIHIDLKQLDSSSFYADKGIALSKKISYHNGMIDLYIKKGIIHCLNKDFEGAMDYLGKAERTIKDNDIKNNKFLINLKYAKAHCFYEKEMYHKAISLLKEILPLFGDPIDPRKGQVLKAHRLLAKSLEKIGSADEALSWYAKHDQLKDQSHQNQRQTVDKIHKKDTKDLDLKIEKLRKDQLKRKRNYWYILIILSIGILTLIMLLIKYRKKQKSNKVVFNNLMEKITTLEALEQKATSSVKEIIINDNKIAAIIERLNKLEKQEYYLNSSCNLRSVAKKVKTNATYLSKIINTHKAKNFNDYINDLRIDYTIKRLRNDKQFRSFSIKSIATEVGYKSDYSFAKHFKSKTGLNPSYYIKQINQLQIQTNQ